MIKIQIDNNVFISSKDIEKIFDLEQEIQSLGYNFKVENSIFYFIDDDDDKVIITNDNDLKYFKNNYPKSKLKVEKKPQNNDRVYNREIVKDAMKQKIMQLLQQY